MKTISLILTCLFMATAWSQEQTTTIYLIRHAEKAEGAATADPGLSDAGKKRAEKWASYFNDKNIDAIYTTPYNRTKETIAPVARGAANGKSVSVSVYEPRELSLNILNDKHKGKTLLVVGHSNTIPAYINQLTGESRYTDMQESDYSNLYIITINGDKITHELVKI